MNIREKLVEILGEFLLWPSKMKNVWMPQGIEKLADHLIAHGVTVQEWISVKDWLPTREDANETESILAINKDEKCVSGWAWYIVARWPTAFTYWMPLPPAPKGE